MSANTVEITKNNMKDILEKNEIVFLDFWASWCGPCRLFGKIYEKAASKYPEIVFGKVNTESEQQLAYEFQIASIPTVVAFRQNIPVFAQPGLIPEEALEDIIKQIQNLDMAKVKAEVESNSASEVLS